MTQTPKTKTKVVPSYTGTLRSHSLSLPRCVSECSGIRIFGKRIKSLAFTTDVAIVKNINADAIMAVYRCSWAWAAASPAACAPTGWPSRPSTRGPSAW